MKFSLYFILALVIVMQFFPVEHTNPKSDPALEITLPDTVKPLVKNACYDCHSNHTVWPWYSHVAPISFSVGKHVEDGRAVLNFSEWNGYDEATRAKKLAAIARTVYAAMPLGSYITFHAEADLTKEQRTMIRNWAWEQPEYKALETATLHHHPKDTPLF